MLWWSGAVAGPPRLREQVRITDWTPKQKPSGLRWFIRRPGGAMCEKSALADAECDERGRSCLQFWDITRARPWEVPSGVDWYRVDSIAYALLSVACRVLSVRANVLRSKLARTDCMIPFDSVKWNESASCTNVHTNQPDVRVLYSPVEYILE